VNALIQFSVTNFRSFGRTAALSMVAPTGTTEGVMVVPAHPALRLLRVAALFGANASGKSNLLRAMWALTRLARGQALAVSVDPFRLTRAGFEAPTEFQVDAVLGDLRVTYVLSCTRLEVKAEALYATTQGAEEAVVFEREPGAEVPLTLGPMLGAEGSNQRQFFALNAEGTPRDQVLLHDLVERSRETPHRVALLDAFLEWLQRGFLHVRPETRVNLFAGGVDQEFVLSYLGDQLARYDTGIQKLTMGERHALDVNERRLLRGGDVQALAMLEGQLDRRGLFIQRSGDGAADLNIVSLMASHAQPEEEGEALSFVDESDGTKRLLHLLPLIRREVPPRCLLIDELDRSLHAAAAQQFVRDFLTARPDDQLIFTTHDTTLLDMPEIPPASVWLVEKDATGCSTLHSLAEVKPEQLAHFGGRFAAGYLQGRFGGVPHLRPAERGE